MGPSPHARKSLQRRFNLSLTVESKLCLHCASMSPPVKTMDNEEHMIFECPRFNAQRKKFLESVTTEERLRLAHGTPTIKLQQILTSRDPTTWRLFAWMLSRIFAIRRRGWETYQREKLLTTQDRQKKRNRAPRRAAAVKKMNDNK